MPENLLPFFAKIKHMDRFSSRFLYSISSYNPVSDTPLSLLQAENLPSLLLFPARFRFAGYAGSVEGVVLSGVWLSVCCVVSPPAVPVLSTAIAVSVNDLHIRTYCVETSETLCFTIAALASSYPSAPLSSRSSELSSGSSRGERHRMSRLHCSGTGVIFFNFSRSFLLPAVPTPESVC